MKNEIKICDKEVPPVCPASETIKCSLPGGSGKIVRACHLEGSIYQSQFIHGLAMSHAGMLACPFGECPWGQIPRPLERTC